MWKTRRPEYIFEKKRSSWHSCPIHMNMKKGLAAWLAVYAKAERPHEKMLSRHVSILGKKVSDIAVDFWCNGRETNISCGYLLKCDICSPGVFSTSLRAIASATLDLSTVISWVQHDLVDSTTSKGKTFRTWRSCKHSGSIEQLLI